MEWKGIVHRLAHFGRRGDFDAELDDEIRFHIEERVDELKQAGMAHEEAEAQARREFGSSLRMKEESRAAWQFRWLEDLLADVRYASRLLARNPLFALTAALSLSIGIAANTTIFTIANSLLFRPPPGVVEPGRLVNIGRTEGRSRFGSVSYPNYIDVRNRTTTLDSVYAHEMVAQAMSLRGPEDVRGAERVFGGFVSTNYFSALGLRPAAGRLFNADDSDQPGGSPFVVMSHGLWTRRFDADPGIVGQMLQINGFPFTVVGVAPAGFVGITVFASDLWLPVNMMDAASRSWTSALTAREFPFLMLGGRLKPGVSVPEAAAELDAMARVLEREYPDQNRGKGLRVMEWSLIPGDEIPIGAFLGLLMGIVSIVLVIACANLSGLLLARASARRQEIAVRLAMGAGRLRLVRQLLTETLMLFVVGAAIGLLLARGMTSLLVALLPTLPVQLDVSLPLDARVLAFAAALSFVAAVLCGLVPALQASRADLVSSLKNTGDAASDRLWIRNAFVVGQVALSLVLVIGAGLFARGLQNVGSIDPGFDLQSVEVTALDLSLAGYTNENGRDFVRELIDRTRKIPGVQLATAASNLPMGDKLGRLPGVTVPGVPPPNGRPHFEPDYARVEPGYFATMKIPLVAGRDFNEGDRAGTQPVAIVGEATARRLWPGQDPLGKSLVLEAVPGIRRPEAAATLMVVGVARDVRYRTLRDDSEILFVYTSLQQQPGSSVNLVARTVDGRRITGEIRELVASMNPNLPIVRAQTLEDFTAISLVPQRVAASVSGSLGIVGLLLAAIGIYGVTAYAVIRRTREIGIRVALGAQRRDVVGMVLRQGMSLAAIGSAIGLLLAAIVSHLLTAWLFGVPPLDPVTFLGATVLFAAIGLAACYVPVRRATRINAIEALRYE